MFSWCKVCACWINHLYVCLIQWFSTFSRPRTACSPRVINVYTTSSTSTNYIQLETFLNSLKVLRNLNLKALYSRNHKLKSTIVHSSMRRFTASLEKTCSNFITIVCFLDQNFNRGHSKIICVLQVYVLSCFKLTEKWLYLLFSVRSGLPYLYPVALTISPRSRK